MCIDCAFGSCLGNSTRCVCDAPYSQSLEMLVYEDIPCFETDRISCLPCDVRVDVVQILYTIGAIVAAVVAVYMVYTLETCRRTVRNGVQLAGLVA